MRFLEKLKLHREAKGLDQDELEPLAGLATGRIARWNGGTGEPTARQALRIARVLGVPVEYLIDDEMEAVPPADGLTDGERSILTIYRKLGITEDEGLDLLLAPRKAISQPAPTQSRRRKG